MKERIEALTSALRGEPDVIRSLLILLLETDRIALVPQIALAFGDLVDQREGIAKARITTAVALDEPARRELVHRLEHESGRRLRATFAVDPTLIGGARVQIGDHRSTHPYTRSSSRSDHSSPHNGEHHGRLPRD